MIVIPFATRAAIECPAVERAVRLLMLRGLTENQALLQLDRWLNHWESHLASLAPPEPLRPAIRNIGGAIGHVAGLARADFS